MVGERSLPGIGLKGYWTAGSDGWDGDGGMDGNLRALSALTQLAVKSQTVALPGSPVDGDIYIEPAGDRRVAVRDNGAWVYLTASEGYRAWVSDEDKTYVFNGTDWIVEVAEGGDASYPDFAGNRGRHLAVNVAEDGVEWVDPPEGGGGSTSPAKGARMQASVPQTLSGMGMDQLAFGAVEFDVGYFVDPAEPNSFVIPEGVTRVVITAGYRFNASGEPREIEFSILRGTESVAFARSGVQAWGADTISTGVIAVEAGDIITAWLWASAVGDIEEGSSTFITIELADVVASGIEEAPEDGKQYARMDGDWAEVVGGGGGADFPTGGGDGSLLRQNDEGAVEWFDPFEDGFYRAGVFEPYGKHAYWRLVPTRNAGDNRYGGLTELRMKSSPEGTSVAVGGTALASGHYGSRPASNAFDGNTVSGWESQQLPGGTYIASGGVWIGYQFPEPVSIVELGITYNASYYPEERPLDGYVQYSDDGSTWTTAWTFANLTYPSLNQDFTRSPDYSAAGETRYLVPDPAEHGGKLVAAKSDGSGFEYVAGGGGGLSPVISKTADYTLISADMGGYIRIGASGTLTISVPANSTAALPVNGEWHFRALGDVTFVPNGGVTVNIPWGGSLELNAGMTATLKRIGQDEFDLLGQTVAL